MSRITPVDASNSGRPLRPPACGPGGPNPNPKQVRWSGDTCRAARPWTPQTAAARSGRPPAAQAARSLTLSRFVGQAIHVAQHIRGRLKQRPPAQAAHLRPRRPKPLPYAGSHLKATIV